LTFYFFLLFSFIQNIFVFLVYVLD